VTVRNGAWRGSAAVHWGAALACAMHCLSRMTKLILAVSLLSSSLALAGGMAKEKLATTRGTSVSTAGSTAPTTAPESPKKKSAPSTAEPKAAPTK
jgi:hypothetical protein